ncbi:MAG: aminoglycoside phosphotransferase family protein [Roseburia sp.]|nr:aminoglycoside phosphotransferase family protein [Roseburia sp.]MCM1098110.1 aminoglycoside phosphotransferase family protein [Ruminococcus flavefaciens]
MQTVHPAHAEIREVISHYFQEGRLLEIQPYGGGHINDTFLITCEAEGCGQKRYILQRMNHNIFKNPQLLMENVINVTEYLRGVILARGGDPDRETLNVVRTTDGASYYEDSSHNFWRVLFYIEDTLCLDQAETPADFYDSGAAFGNFQRMLTDYPAETLHETIPNFHNTVSRFRDFQRAVQEDRAGRASLAAPEIAFALTRQQEASVLTDALQKGELPLRVTHNDTKLNNILFDKATRKALCIIDLDTVMPGLSLYDYSDSIRFGASTAAEDETDLNLVELDLTLFEAFTKGFLEGCGDILSENEIRLLPMGAKIITYECGLRFLTDYLEGDVYFKIHRENHNLERARTQFKLVEDMERKWRRMTDIVEKCRQI